jgi:hypothetical protein
MFTIQYEASSGAHLMQTLDSDRRYVLVKHLSRFQRPIIAVYEQTTPITKAIRQELRNRPVAMLSSYAREFTSAS